MAERLNLTVDDGVGEMLTVLADGERKRGQWISELVKTLHEQRQQLAVSDIDQLKVSFTGLVGTTMTLERRIVQLERQMAALIGEQTQRPG